MGKTGLRQVIKEQVGVRQYRQVIKEHAVVGCLQVRLGTLGIEFRIFQLRVKDPSEGTMNVSMTTDVVTVTMITILVTKVKKIGNDPSAMIVKYASLHDCHWRVVTMAS